VANSERGLDATGLAVFGKDQTVVARGTVPAYDLIERPEYRRATLVEGGYLGIGHTRLATHGKNIIQNAHPFEEGNVIGAHNGVIMNWSELDKVHRAKFRPAKVDSQAVFRVLSRVKGSDLMGEYARVLPSVDGDMALVWADKRDPGAVYLFRHGNPLSAIVAPSAGAVFWSSEYQPLCASVQTAYGDDWYPVDLKPDTIYRWVWDDEKRDVAEWTQAVTMPKDWTASAWKRWAKEDEPKKGGKKKPRWSEEDEDDLYAAYMKGEECQFCGVITWEEDIGTLIASDGTLLCSACADWWMTDGRQRYGTIEEASAIFDTAGVRANELLGAERKA
jgi:hypothetical protein